MSWCHGWQRTTLHPRYTVLPVHKAQQLLGFLLFTIVDMAYTIDTN
ncbi:MAG: hypothetical protein ACPG52_08945 [Cognaticolwellia sp.]